jgi:AhpD family alkylhydroperoxidase
MFKFIAAAFTASAAAYTEAEREEVLVEIVDKGGFPRLEAWNKITPKMFKTMMTAYGATLAEGAFEYFDSKQIEVIYAAVSAVNNCELCLSFHAMKLGKYEKPSEDIKAIVAGGLPEDPEMRGLVVGAKYALAHKG